MALTFSDAAGLELLAVVPLVVVALPVVVPEVLFVLLPDDPQPLKSASMPQAMITDDSRLCIGFPAYCSPPPVELGG